MSVERQIQNIRVNRSRRSRTALTLRRASHRRQILCTTQIVRIRRVCQRFKLLAIVRPASRRTRAVSTILRRSVSFSTRRRRTATDSSIARLRSSRNETSVSSSSSLSSVTKDLIRCFARRFAGGSAEKVDSVLRGRAGVSRVSSPHAREHGLVSFSTMSKSDPSLDSRTASRVAHSSRSKRANSSARFAQFWHKFSKSDSALSHGARSRTRDVGLRDAVSCIVARIARYVCMAYTNIGALYSEDSLRVGEVDLIGSARLS